MVFSSLPTNPSEIPEDAFLDLWQRELRADRIPQRRLSTLWIERFDSHLLNSTKFDDEDC